jgi:hypothetical protein
MVDDWPINYGGAYPAGLPDVSSKPVAEALIHCWASRSAPELNHDHLCQLGLLHLDHHACRSCGYSW